MTSEQRELLRQALLEVMERNKTKFGLGVVSLGHWVRTMGHYPSPDEIRAEVQYLIDVGYVTALDKTISPENAAWRITAKGRDYVAQQNG